MADPYRYHRLALAPLISDAPQEQFKQAIKNTDFLHFLIRNGLGPLWHEALGKTNTQTLFSEEFQKELHRSSLVTAAEYLRQQHVLKRIEDVYTSQSIPYAVFKGVHIRELIYPNPAVRYACDIDILISKHDKVAGIKALIKAGFAFNPIAENISHEGHLTDGQTSIDLHWDILRPGRTRIDFTDVFLETRRELNGHWYVSNEAALFIMLVHPVFTKYTSTPQASLIRLVDLIRWIKTRQIDWQKVADYLERGGVKTAAWITAAWLELLTGTTLPESFMQRIKPSSLKAVYLQTWLEKNLSTRLLNHPILIQTGFTLPAHDTLQDAVRSTKQFIKEKKNAGQKTKYLLDNAKT